MGNLKGILEAERLMYALQEEIQLYQALLGSLQEAVGGTLVRAILPEEKEIGEEVIFPLRSFFDSPQLMEEQNANGKILPLPRRKGEGREVPMAFEGAGISKEAFGTPKNRILSYQKFQLALKEKETHSQEERR